MKSEYVHHKAISGAIGVKLCATGIEKAVAGTPIMVVGPEDDEEDIKEEVRSTDNSTQPLADHRFSLDDLQMVWRSVGR